MKLSESSARQDLRKFKLTAQVLILCLPEVFSNVSCSAAVLTLFKDCLHQAASVYCFSCTVSL